MLGISIVCGVRQWNAADSQLCEAAFCTCLFKLLTVGLEFHIQCACVFHKSNKLEQLLGSFKFN